MAEPNILTLREVAALLKCHPSTLYRLLKVGGIPAFKIGSDWRFNAEQVNEWSKQTATTTQRERRD